MRYKRLKGKEFYRVLLFVFCVCLFLFPWITRGLGRYIGLPKWVLLTSLLPCTCVGCMSGNAAVC